MSDGRYARSDCALAAVATAPRADPARVPLTLALPGVGRLELRETMHLLRDGDQLIGFVRTRSADRRREEGAWSPGARACRRPGGQASAAPGPDLRAARLLRRRERSHSARTGRPTSDPQGGRPEKPRAAS